MDIYPTPVDRITYLPTPSGATTYGSSTPKQNLDEIHDTIHYLSPATTYARTEYEGDLDYQQFLHIGRKLSGIDKGYASSSTSTISCEEPQLQRTIAIIKPEGMAYKDVILRVIIEAGFKIIGQRTVHLTPEQVAEIYHKYYGNPIFPHMVVGLSIDPILVLSIAGLNAVEKWKTMVGPYKVLREEWFFPYSVRTRFGILPDMPEVLHASENVNEAKRENRYFYPESILEPIVTEEEKVIDYVELYINPTLLNGLTELVRVKPVDPVIFLAEWLLLHNPFQPHLPFQAAMTPT